MPSARNYKGFIETMNELKEIFEGWGDIFSKEAERPHVELANWGDELIKTLDA